MREEIVKTKVVAKLEDGRYVKSFQYEGDCCGDSYDCQMTTTSDILEAADFSPDKSQFFTHEKQTFATPVKVCIQTTVMDELVELGKYVEPCGPHGLEIPQPFYGIRYNTNLACNSRRELGWQVLIDGVGGLRWINVDPFWIQDCPEKSRVTKSLINCLN